MSFSPSFSFYTKEWLSSLWVKLLPIAWQGGYANLLFECWEQDDCGLPDDDVILAEASRLREEWFKGAGVKLREKFVLKDGRVYNDRLLRERRKQEHNRQERSKAGRESGKSRRKPKPPHQEEIKKTPLLSKREEIFKAQVFAQTTFPAEMLQTFFNYWSEPDHRGKKMRFEKQETWDLKRRLDYWQSRDNSFGKAKPSRTTYDHERNAPSKYDNLPGTS